jgi:hypothetical protein
MFGGLTFGGAPFAGVVAAVAGLFASPSVSVTATAQFSDAHAGLAAYSATYGGTPFGGVPYAGTVTGTSRLAAAITIRVGVEPARLGALSRLNADATIPVTATAQLTTQIFLRALNALIEFDAGAQLARLYGGEFWLGGINVSGKVRKDGVSIRDVLNDAPNTASLTFGGTAVPQVGLPLEIRLSHPAQVLFSGTLQTVDRSYEGSKPSIQHWPTSAIDDTQAANRRRPFGSWVDVSASTVAAAIATYAPPGFTTRIQAGLPPVTFVCDGSETMIAAFVRLANMVGGYAKIENKALHLFIEDTTDPPDPVDLAHPPLDDPPIRLTTDVSQLRTRVYGKGYGENVPAAVNAGETLIPITDGTQFTQTGGKAIAGTTADSAQSQLITYGGVNKPLGGTLVGPGAAPANAPALALAAGGVVANGLHEVAVVHVTANGKSLAGPRGAITIGPVAPPTAAPVAGAATSGTGPDEGDHQYAITNLAIGGETTLGPASNVVHTSAAFGQIPADGVVIIGTPVDGSGVDVGYHDYVQTFVNAQGETTPSQIGNQVYNGNIVGGVNPPGAPTVNTPQIGAGVDIGAHTYAVTFVTAEGETTLGSQSASVSTVENAGELAAPGQPADDPVSPVVAGNLNDANDYYYLCTFVTAVGETTPGARSTGADSPPLPVGPPGIWNGSSVSGGSMGPGQYTYHLSGVTASGYETDIAQYSTIVQLSTGTAVEFTKLEVSADPRVVKRNLYRTKAGNLPSGRMGYLIATINDNVTKYYKDTLNDSSINTSNAYYERGFGSPDGPRGTPPGWQARVYGIPTGPAGTTARKLYRHTDPFAQSSAYRLITTITDNSTTQYIDNIAPASEGTVPPTVNSTGQAAHQIPLTNIPTGSGTVTQRKLYRNSAGGGWRLLDTIPNNTATVYTDTKPNQQLGANPPSTNGTGRAAQNLPLTFYTGPAGVTGRKLYRRFYSAATGFSTFKLSATFNDNSTTTYLDTKANSSLGQDAPTSNTTGTAQQRVPVTNIPLSPSGGRRLYRFSAGAWRFLTELTSANQTTYTDGTPNSGLGAAPPSTNTATGNQISMSQIPTGGSQVTSREIYMTLTGGGTLRLAMAIADNTTRDAMLNVSDATLAGQPTPPSADTSGLTQPTGQVNPGSPTLIVASPAPFDPAGGWVVTGGGQVLRYYGVSGQLLTGIPATGAGAIVTTILYGQQATPAPTLIAVTGLSKAMQRGAAVHIWIQRDDLLAQSEQATRDGSDGIVEFLLVDARRSEPSLITRCDADLALFSRPIITVQYATRDTKTKSGKRVSINLPVPPIQAVLTIQDVTITEIDIADGLRPKFSVTASSVRFSLEDTLRRLVGSG